MKIFVDMDGVLCDYEKAWNAEKKGRASTYFPQSTPGFFKELNPIPGAIAGIKRLAKKYDVYILTSPSVKNSHCWSEKAEWVEYYLGAEWLEKLIITKNKGLLHKFAFNWDTDRTYLIDDSNTDAVGGRDTFFEAGDMYWFSGFQADWYLVESFFGVQEL